MVGVRPGPPPCHGIEYGRGHIQLAGKQPPFEIPHVWVPQHARRCSTQRRGRQAPPHSQHLSLLLQGNGGVKSGEQLSLDRGLGEGLGCGRGGTTGQGWEGQKGQQMVQRGLQGRHGVSTEGRGEGVRALG